VIRRKSFARKFLRCGVVAFADGASSLSPQNNKISVREPRKPRRFLAGDRRAKEKPRPQSKSKTPKSSLNILTRVSVMFLPDNTQFGSTITKSRMPHRLSSGDQPSRHTWPPASSPRFRVTVVAGKLAASLDYFGCSACIPSPYPERCLVPISRLTSSNDFNVVSEW
jgi:hypothetical protein